MKTATAPLPPLRSVKVLDQLRERIRYLHYSLRTEQAYVHWVRAFIRFHGVRHPATLGSSEVEAFLSWLANERKVSVSTHRQALAALLFFYGKVLCTDLPWLQEIGRPRPSRRLPVVLTPDEVVRILGFLEGEHRLFAQLLYGTGMRISEGLQLLAALVPPPRAHLTRFHGVFAPNANLRAQLTPSGRGKRPASDAVPVDVSAHDEPRSPEQKRRAMSWAQRLKRVFSIDVTTCAHCGGAVRIVASIEDPKAIRAILAHFEKHRALEQAHYRPAARAPPPAA